MRLAPYGECIACGSAVYVDVATIFPDVCTMCRCCFEPLVLAPAPDTQLRAAWRPLTLDEQQRWHFGILCLTEALLRNVRVRA